MISVTAQAYSITLLTLQYSSSRTEASATSVAWFKFVSCSKVLNRFEFEFPCLRLWWLQFSYFLLVAFFIPFKFCMGGQSSIITYSKSLMLFISKGDLYTRIRERNERYFTEVVSFIMSCDYNYLLTREWGIRENLSEALPIWSATCQFSKAEAEPKPNVRS